MHQRAADWALQISCSAFLMLMTPSVAAPTKPPVFDRTMERCAWSADAARVELSRRQEAFLPCCAWTVAWCMQPCLRGHESLECYNLRAQTKLANRATVADSQDLWQSGQYQQQS